MAIGLIGQKCGMTRVFTDAGDSIPVTIIEVLPHHVVQLKTVETDGYRAVQVTTGTKRASKLTKAIAGIFAKAKVEAGRGLWEFRLDDNEGTDYTVGAEIKVDMFTEGTKIDVIGTTIGKGFAGVIKKYHFAMQDATHGNSLAHRAPGSIGQRQDPGKVFKGKKMAGHMGNVRRTIQNLDVVRVDVERNLLFVKGAIPGAKSKDVIVQPAVKVAGESHGA